MRRQILSSLSALALLAAWSSGCAAHPGVDGSGGASDSSQTTPDAEGKSYDPMCGKDPVVRPDSNGKAIVTDALQGAPPAGSWFEDDFLMLVRKAPPAF